MSQPTASTPPPSAASLFNPEVEAGCLSLLLQFPDTWADFHLIQEGDWSKTNRPLFAVLSGQLNSTPQGSVTPIVLSEKLKGYGIASVGPNNDVGVYDYLEGLRIRCSSKQDASALARELKRLSVRRQLIEKAESVKRDLIRNQNASFEEMTKMVEQGLSSVATEYFKPEVEEVLGDAIITTVEARADNPIDPAQMPYQGPFQSLNKTVGPLIYPGSFTTIIARTAVGKSSFSFFYCVSVAEQYDLDLLWLDAAEMTVEQLQMRAVCCLSGGRIPLWAVKSGEWRNNPVWLKLVRDEIWPRVKRLRMYYKNVGGMSPKEKTSFIRRFYYNRVGRGRFLIIGDDYLKGVESLSKQSAEYQALGYYVGDVKTLVTDEILAGYWTSLQGNRSIITAGKKVHELQDSGEAGAGISDRVVQQSTNAFLMRFKVMEELAAEQNRFGNMVLKRAKVREGYGREYEHFMRPIKQPNGQFTDNYWHMQGHSFFYQDMGLHSEVMEKLGHLKVDMRVAGQGMAPL